MVTDIITLAIQEWDTHYKWWAPNSINMQHEVHDARTLPATHDTQWFNLIVGESLTSEEILNCEPSHYEFLLNNKNVQFTPLDSILPGTKYIYPIFIKSGGYFNQHKDIGFDYVSGRVLDDVRAGIARIVLIFPCEGLSGAAAHKDDFTILSKWCTDKQLLANSVYYIHANLKLKQLSAGHNFTAIPVNTFITWVEAPGHKVIEYCPTSDRNLFLNYNRQPRLHRTLMVCELLKTKLFNRGLVSYGIANQKEAVKQVDSMVVSSDLLDMAVLLDNMSPIELDMNLQYNNPAKNVVDEHYAATFLSLVAETWHDNNLQFYSEKTWKTIAVGHPFMMLSSPGMLSGLHEQGYQTFSNFWDESYDTMPLLEDRIQLIAAELGRLSLLTTDELIGLRTQMQPILEHNQQLFRSHREKMVGTNLADDLYLYDIVKNIWDLF